jgi:hypothetical protein
MMVNECLAVTELYHITGKVGGDNIWWFVGELTIGSFYFGNYLSSTI